MNHTEIELFSWEPGNRITVLSAIGALLTVISYYLLGGLLGLGIAVFLSIAIVAVEGPVWFVLAQFPLLLFPHTLLETTLLEIGFLPVLFAPFLRVLIYRLPIFLSFVFVLGVIVATAFLTSLVNTLWFVAVLIVGASTLLTYMLHRYELLQLGLLGEEIK